MFSHSNTASFFCVLIAAFIFSLSAVGGAWASQAAGEHRSRERGGGGKIKIVYDEAGVKPENLDAFRIVKESGRFDRIASWMNDRIDLPVDIRVMVTDAVPAGVHNHFGTTPRIIFLTPYTHLCYWLFSQRS